MSNRLSIAGITSLAAILAVSFVIVLWVNDVRSDRKHTITVRATTPVFVGEGAEGGCNGKQLTTLERGIQLPIQRIRYFKDCATIDVTLPDGRHGYFVLGLGDLAVNPPLPNT